MNWVGDHSYITQALVRGERVRKYLVLLILSTKNMLWEHPSMMFNFRVGKGVQSDMVGT